MEAVSRGFQEGKTQVSNPGVVLGILPGGDVSAGNPFLDVVVPTGMGIARNAVLVQTADVLLAIGGGSGTLSEMAMGWQLGKEIVSLTASGGTAKRFAGEAIDDRRAGEVVLAAADAKSAVDLVLERLRAR